MVVRRAGKRIAGILMVGLALASASAASAQQAAAGGAEAQPSVDLPPELARVLRDYETHWSRGEASELAALFVEHGLIQRNGVWIRGRDAIRAAYETASGPLRLRAIEYGADGSTGFIVGAYGYGDALPIGDVGLFVLTLHREDGGRWLIVSDLDRSGM